VGGALATHLGRGVRKDMDSTVKERRHGGPWVVGVLPNPPGRKVR
jgi:hypothetical protein